MIPCFMRYPTMPIPFQIPRRITHHHSQQATTDGNANMSTAINRIGLTEVYRPPEGRIEVEYGIGAASITTSLHRC